ncbi:Gamma-glutamyltransferase [Dactylellina cionopaga]|nr:Gamma-glutamyltransferase [Dactylellina cionopaga]
MGQTHSQLPASRDEEASPITETSPLIGSSTSSAHARPSTKRRIRSCNSRPYLSHSATSFIAIILIITNSVLFIFIITDSARHGNPRRTEDPNLLDHLVTARHGAVATDVEVCSEIGVDMLRLKNGTAVDALIASGLCIGVINMYSSGLGGGGFMVIRHPNGTSHSMNFREMAPGAAFKDMFNHDPKLAQHGGLAVGIPGEVMGYWTAWNMYGRVPWKELFEPSIKICEEGARVTPHLRGVMEESKWLLKADRREWGFLFKDGGEELLDEGDLMFRPSLAKSFREIAEKGPDGFYKGRIAESLVEFVQEKGGILTMEDMGKYEVIVEDTLKVWAFGQEILTCALPCSGAVLIEGLNIAEGLDMSNDESGLVTHRIIETMKWLSAGRTELGDPYDSEVSNAARIAEIQTKQFASMVRRNISDTRTYGWRHYNPSYEMKESKGTSHLSALDAEGMAAALTTTVNLYFGAKICDPETGKG